MSKPITRRYCAIHGNHGNHRTEECAGTPYAIDVYTEADALAQVTS